MAVLPTFEPAQAPSVAPEMGLQSENDAQNWMTQAAQRGQIQANTQATQQETAQNAQKFATLLPALAAKANSDTLSFQNDAASATIQQQLRGQWQSMKPQVVQDIGTITDPNNIPKEADGTPDWEAIYQKYENLQAKYGALALLPEGKQYYDMIDQGKKNAFEMAARHAQAQMTLNQLKLGAQYRVAGQEQVQNNKAAIDTATKPAIAQNEAVNTQRNKGFEDISSQRDALGQMGFAIGNIGQDLQAEQSSTLGSGPLVGSSAAAMVRPSVRQVQQDIGDFATRIMSTVKNIRNINEFRAVTASIPHPDDQASVQNEKLAKLQQVNQVLTQRNDYKEQVLRADPALTPDQADQQATVKYPFPASIIGPIVKATPPSSLSPLDAQALEWAKANPKDPRAGAILQRIGTIQ